MRHLTLALVLLVACVTAPPNSTDVRLSAPVKKQLSEWWAEAHAPGGVEWLAVGYGTASEERVWVTSVRRLNAVGTRMGVRPLEPLPTTDSVVAHIHSHLGFEFQHGWELPPLCRPSSTDSTSFTHIQRAHRVRALIIMCEENMYAFQTRPTGDVTIRRLR